MSAPQSTIHICSGVRLNSRYDHSIYFASATAQASYFSGKVVRTYTAYTFLRKSWPLKVEATMAQAKSWTYLYFQNGGIGKVYYYFINNIEYINDHTVELSLELDVLQTYMFDYTLLPSFVERQHVEDDTPGKHTQEEGLDPGEYHVEAAYDVTDMKTLCIMVLTSVGLNGTSAETTITAYGGMYNNVFSGLKLYAIPITRYPNWTQQLDRLSEWGKIDGIVGMWMYPQQLVKLGGEATWDEGDFAKVVSGTASLDFSVPMAQSGTINGYTPKNNKLYCYPYNFLYATNHNGGSAVYRYERFPAGSSEASFTINGALSPDTGARLVPVKQYNGADSYTEGLTLGSYPSCAWEADGYKIWLAQNQNQHEVAMTNGVIKAAVGGVSAVGSLVMGNLMGAAGGAGMVYSGISDIQQLIAAREDKAVEPPQARGSFSSNLNVVNHKHNFAVLRKTVTAEYARRIDGFFTMYGYRINQVKIPSRHARESFTYVKTVGCHIAANLCNEDTVKIESIYDHGITWWTDGDRIGDYFQTNNTL